jgi:hypothetical protein
MESDSGKTEIVDRPQDVTAAAYPDRVDGDEHAVPESTGEDTSVPQADIETNTEMSRAQNKVSRKKRKREREKEKMKKVAQAGN